MLLMLSSKDNYKLTTQELYRFSCNNLRSIIVTREAIVRYARGRSGRAGRRFLWGGLIPEDIVKLYEKYFWSYRGCPVIQNPNKKETIWSFKSKKKQEICY